MGSNKHSSRSETIFDCVSDTTSLFSKNGSSNRISITYSEESIARVFGKLESSSKVKHVTGSSFHCSTTRSDQGQPNIQGKWREMTLSNKGVWKERAEKTTLAVNLSNQRALETSSQNS